jgi:hypothetical protein
LKALAYILVRLSGAKVFIVARATFARSPEGKLTLKVRYVLKGVARV